MKIQIQPSTLGELRGVAPGDCLTGTALHRLVLLKVSSWVLVTFGATSSWGGGPVHYRMFPNIPGLYPLDTSGISSSRL